MLKRKRKWRRKQFLIKEALNIKALVQVLFGCPASGSVKALKHFLRSVLTSTKCFELPKCNH